MAKALSPRHSCQEPSLSKAVGADSRSPLASSPPAPAGHARRASGQAARLCCGAGNSPAHTRPLPTLREHFRRGCWLTDLMRCDIFSASLGSPVLRPYTPRSELAALPATPVADRSPRRASRGRGATTAVPGTVASGWIELHSCSTLQFWLAPLSHGSQAELGGSETVLSNCIGYRGTWQDARSTTERGGTLGGGVTASE